jgi:hypothetical protein
MNLERLCRNRTSNIQHRTLNVEVPGWKAGEVTTNRREWSRANIIAICVVRVPDQISEQFCFTTDGLGSTRTKTSKSTIDLPRAVRNAIRIRVHRCSSVVRIDWDSRLFASIRGSKTRTKRSADFAKATTARRVPLRETPETNRRDRPFRHAQGPEQGRGRGRVPIGIGKRPRSGKPDGTSGSAWLGPQSPL